MESIKATVEGSDRSVEFSLEEAMMRHQGPAWGQLNEQERDEALKDYARLLLTRQGGTLPDTDMRIRLERGTFSRTEGGAT